MFDYRGFLEKVFTNPPGLRAFVSAFGVSPPPQGTVEKWFQRDTVSAPWFAVLLVLIELDRGRPISLAPYFQEETR